MKPENLSTLDASAKAKPEKRFVVFQAEEGLISLIDDYAKATQVSRGYQGCFAGLAGRQNARPDEVGAR